MVSLRRKKHRDILYKRIIEALGGQIKDPWERRMFRSMVKQTRFRPVGELGGRDGWELKGENVHHVIIDSRGHKYIGPATVYVPAKTLKRLKWLESKDSGKMAQAEEALQTVSHELAHDYFKAINYEARLTRYLRDNPKIVERYMGRFLGRAGGFNDSSVGEKAKKLVKKNPLYWARYVAHTAHEAGADMMAAESVTKISKGRHARARDLDRLTAFRPFTVREFARVQHGERLMGVKKPRKPSRMAELAKGIEYTSMRVMENVGGLYRASHPSEARIPPRSFAGRALHKQPRRRAA